MRYVKHNERPVLLRKIFVLGRILPVRLFSAQVLRPYSQLNSFNLRRLHSRPKSANTFPIVEHYVRDYLTQRFGEQIAEDIKPLENTEVTEVPQRS
jgi:hypothetical protein